MKLRSIHAIIASVCFEFSLFLILFINFLVFCFFYFQGVEFAAPNAEILAASTVAAANNQAHQHPDAIALPDHQISAFNNSHIWGLDIN